MPCTLWEATLRVFSVELAIGTEERGVDALTVTYCGKSSPVGSRGFLVFRKPIAVTICQR